MKVIAKVLLVVIIAAVAVSAALFLPRFITESNLTPGGQAGTENSDGIPGDNGGVIVTPKVTQAQGPEVPLLVIETDAGRRLELEVGEYLKLESTLGSSINTSEIEDRAIQFRHLAGNGCVSGQVIQYNGSNWVCGTLSNNVGGLTGQGVTVTISGGENKTIVFTSVGQQPITSEFSDLNNFVTSMVFNSGNGELSLERNQLTPLVVDLDGRFVTAGSSTTFINKSGAISMWSNDAGYITTGSVNNLNNKTINLASNAIIGSPNSAAVFDGEGKLTYSGVSINELNMLSGVSSNLQAQINAKLNNELDPRLPAAGANGNLLQSNGTTWASTSLGAVFDLDWTGIANDAGIYMDYRPNNSACSNNEVIKYAVGTGWVCASDENNYSSGLSFDNTTGALSLNRQGMSDVTANFDGRYALVTHNHAGTYEPVLSTGTTLQYLRGDKTWQTLNTNVVAEGTNQYFTNTRARQALSATAPVSYDNSTGVISMLSATSSRNGYLTSSDWSSFNGKLSSVNWSQIQNSAGIYADYRPNNTACANNQVLKYVAGTGWVCANDTDVDTDNYLTGASFNTSDGNLTLTRTGALGSVTVDLDGRFAADAHTHIQLHDQNTDTATDGTNFTVGDGSTTFTVNTSTTDDQILINGGTYSTTLVFTQAATSNKTITFPNKSGTVAMMTDLTWSNLSGFPSGCPAGQAVTTVGGSLTCSSFLTSEVDAVIGNEVVNATSAKGLIRAGSGTSGDPYTLGVNYAVDCTGANQKLLYDGTTGSWSCGTDLSSDGSVTSVASGNGLSGGPITNSGTLALGDLTSNWSQSGAFDIILNNSASDLVMMDASGDGFFGTFNVGDLTANQTYTFTAGGMVWTNGNDGAGSLLDADLLDGNSSAAFALSGHNHTLNALSDVTVTAINMGEILKWTGSVWENNTLAEAGIEPVQTKGSVTGAGSISVTNGANSTVGPNVGISIDTASATTDGALSATDWGTFNGKQAGDADLTAVAGLTTTGLAVRTATDAWTTRALATTGNGISVANGDGISGNPTFSLNIGTGSTQVAAGDHTHATLTRGTGLTGSNYTGAAATTWALDTANANTWTASQSYQLQSAVQLLPYGASGGQTSESRFLELAANGVQYSGFKAPDAITTSQIYTLPATAANGLLRNTTGDLTWDTNSYITGNQTITLSGDVSGSGTTSITTALGNSGVTAGTYNNLTVNAKGIVTGASNQSYVTGSGTLNYIAFWNGAGSLSTISSTYWDSANNKLVVGGGTGKLDVGTVDPIFTVGNETYSTYLPGMIGVKEELSETITLSNYDAINKTYFADLVFDKEVSEKLYVYSKISDFGDNWQYLSVILTAASPNPAWYKKESAANVLRVYCKDPVEVSVRLTANRFDHADWKFEQGENYYTKGFVVE